MKFSRDGRPSYSARKSFAWRIVIPNLQQYKGYSSKELLSLKTQVLQRIRFKEDSKGLRYYHVAIEFHDNGVPHLDILLVYDKSVLFRLTHFDYILKHGCVTAYSKLNRAILDYGKKEDKEALSNLPETKVLPCGRSVNQILESQELEKDPYRYFRTEMLKDPLHFSFSQYCYDTNLDPYVSNWTCIKTKLKDIQSAAANTALRNKPGFRYIDRALIQSRLTPEQLHTYDSWSGYQTIVDYLNQIVAYKFKRPFKSKQLLLVGPVNTGKTSLVRQIQKYNAVYHMDVSNWFPRYRDGVYSLFFWDQFKLKGGMSHNDLLKFLQGSPMDLQYKGGSSLRQDNQLIIMTSNMTLQQHIDLKFKDPDQRQLARKNLLARISQIVLPPKINLFLLQKLIVNNFLISEVSI